MYINKDFIILFLQGDAGDRGPNGELGPKGSRGRRVGVFYNKIW